MMYFISQRTIERQNGFNRSRIFSAKEPLSLLEVNGNHIAYPCGISQSHLYFQSDLPAILYSTDKNLSRLDTVRLRADLNPLYPRPKPFVCFVDSPSVTIFAGNVPAILRTHLYDTSSAVIYPKVKFSRALALGANFYLRAVDTALKSQELCMVSKGSLNYCSDQTGKKNDGGLLGDGLLIADRSTDQLIYVHFYNNRIAVYDTGLQVLKQFHSVDTFSTGQLSTVNYKNGYTANKPKFIIQKWAAASDGLLYVCSLIKADNQSRDDFSQNTTIDIYNYHSGKYLKSIYVPNRNGHKLNTFSVYGRNLVAVYQDLIAVYLLG